MTRAIQKNAALIATIALSSIFAGAAHAENKLFPTDILDPGQVDAYVSLHGEELKATFEDVPNQMYDHESTHRTSLTASMRYGVGASLHIGADVAANSDRAHDQWDGQYGTSPRFDEKASGIAGGSVWAKYGFLNNKNSPLTLSGEFGVESATTHNLARTSEDDAYVAIDAGWNFGNGIKGFSTASFSVPNRGFVAKVEALSAGAWIAINDGLTIIPSLSVTHFQESSESPSRNRLGLGIGGLFNLDRNTYIEPAIRVEKYDAVDFSDGIHANASTLKSVGIEVYHLY